MKIQKLEGYDNIYELDVCYKERQSLFGKNKDELKKYDKWLHRQLLFLDKANKSEIVASYPRFEYLSQEDGIIFFSIRRTEAAGNPRIIAALIPKSGNNAKLMLVAFKETGPGGYMDYLETAKRRLNMIERGGEDEC